MSPYGLRPHDPQHLCPACGAEDASVAFHEEVPLLTFGPLPGFPCEEDPGAGPHLCIRCRACGCQWTEEPATRPPEGGTLGEGDERTDGMSIRKTGAVTGRVTGIEAGSGALRPVYAEDVPLPDPPPEVGEAAGEERAAPGPDQEDGE